MKPVQQQLILKSLPAIVLLLIISACKNQGNKKTEDTADKMVNNTASASEIVFDKMTGTWQSEDGKSFERWTKSENGTYQSVAFSVKGNDTSRNEQANIYPENDNWVFENTVKGQNDGKAVKFVSSLLNESSVQFSNAAHYFPTDINYTVADANTIHAFIIGPNNKGGKDTIPFNYTRVK